MAETQIINIILPSFLLSSILVKQIHAATDLYTQFFLCFYCVHMSSDIVYFVLSTIFISSYFPVYRLHRNILYRLINTEDFLNIMILNACQI